MAALRTICLLGSLLLLAQPVGYGLARGGEHAPAVLSLGWDGVVAQSRSNSCGPAVIATLLGWKSGTEVSEQAVLARARMTEVGVSLAEFERLAEEFGLPGRWLRAPSSSLPANIELPVVVHLKRAEGHFAIARERLGDYLLLADPARGNVMVPRRQFSRNWSGLVFTGQL